MCAFRKFVCGTMLLLIFGSLQAQNWEQRMLESLSAHRQPGMTRFMQGVSNTTSYISLAIPAGIFVVGAIRHEPGTKYKGFFIAETIVTATALELALKYTINRPRPSDRDPLIIPASDNGGPSFPSGHVSSAFATATSLSIAYPKWYIIAPSFLWAGAVGYSRLYLGVHYPTDVLGGAIVGAGSALLCYKLNKWLFPVPCRRKFGLAE